MSISMWPSYSIEPIVPATIDRAYPLLQGVAPELSLDQWRQFCRGVAAPAGHDPANERETAILAINAQGYVKGLCIYAVRDHWMYGRMLDVPVFAVASAADAEGVASEFLRFLQEQCHKSVASGIRFWTMGGETWRRRLDADAIRRADQGVFLPAITSVAQMHAALSAGMLTPAAVIDRLSR